MVYREPDIDKRYTTNEILDLTMFSKILFKKALTKVFIDIRKCYGNVLPWKNFCFNQLTNRKSKNQHKKNQEEVKAKNIFS